jgi:dihydroneopterin aldolase
VSDRDRISLVNLRFLGHHGDMPEEREAKQPFEVDLIVHLDLSAAAASDDLDETVDYGPLAELVRRVVEERSYRLIEALAGAIAAEVLAAAARVDEVEVRVRKPHAPLRVSFETVEATVVRRRT